jgi:hypothetical protein
MLGYGWDESPRSVRKIKRLHWAASRAGEMSARRQVSAQSAGHRLVAAAAACGYVGPEVARTINSAFARSGLRFEVG